MFGRTPPEIGSFKNELAIRAVQPLILKSDSAEQFVELLVVANGELQVTRIDASLLVVASRVAGQLEHFRREVLEGCCQVDLHEER
ncbi:hypothetical protein WR25_17776 [Diploscapter pachys]|uniref:Uncharacterized protein n=1 Tax=Diploscapter pachys TaxID=2018661 RepID=A0A2A2JGR4_9BILA|nr:hypothetical protein WR25_17776 [Diploscapter pachys]